MKLGIIGCGGIAHKFAQACQIVGGIELVVAARDADKAADFAKQYNATAHYGGYQAMLDNEQLDGVYIALTHNFHYDWIVACLNKRIPVLCEKPMVLTEKEAAALFDLAKAQDTLLVEAIWTKMHAGFLLVKDWLHSGRIGKLSLIETNFGNHVPYDPANRFYNPELAGGAMYDLGVYNIQFTCGLLDSQPLAITGYAHIGETGVDEQAVLNMQFADGVMATANFTFHCQTHREASIYGDKGYMRIGQFYQTQTVTLYDKAGTQLERWETPQDNGFVYQVEHFVDLLRTRAKESPLATPAGTIGCANIFDQLNQQWGIKINNA